MIYAAGGIVHLRCGPPPSPGSWSFEIPNQRSSTSQRLPDTAGCPRYGALPSSIPMITTSCRLPPLPVRHADQPRDPAANRHDPREWHASRRGVGRTADVDLVVDHDCTALRRLLIFASVVTLALNVADPLVVGLYGKAAFDAVGPLLLIGWAEVSQDLLRARTTASRPAEATPADVKSARTLLADEPSARGNTPPKSPKDDAKPAGAPAGKQSIRPAFNMVDDDLLDQAKEEDARHWDAHRRPISADTLRKRLRIGAARSRLLVAMIRADSQCRSAQAETAPSLTCDVR
jgi:hypothetical protein